MARLLLAMMLLAAPRPGQAFVTGPAHLFTVEPSSTPWPADIHLPVSGDAQGAAVQAGAALARALGPGADGVDLGKLDKPHVTLYLTQWRSERLPDVKAAMAKLTPTLPRCKVCLGAPYASGTYAMWNVTNSACLQQLSDRVVNATHVFAEPNQPVPGWVKGLPAAQRARKTYMVQRYGSPNVFSEFAPHVTIGWAADAAAVTRAVASLRARPAICFSALDLAIGTVGPHGTVLRGKDLADYDIPAHGATPTTLTASTQGLWPTAAPTGLWPTTAPTGLWPTAAPTGLWPTAAPTGLWPTAAPTGLWPTTAPTGLWPTTAPTEPSVAGGPSS